MVTHTKRTHEYVEDDMVVEVDGTKYGIDLTLDATLRFTWYTGTFDTPPDQEVETTDWRVKFLMVWAILPDGQYDWQNPRTLVHDGKRINNTPDADKIAEMAMGTTRFWNWAQHRAFDY